MIKVISIENQTLFDIANQELGSIDQVVGLAKENSMSLTEVLPAGTELVITQNQDNKTVVSFYIAKQKKPATGGGIPCLNGGINYMEIGGNFKVSSGCEDHSIGSGRIGSTFRVSPNAGVGAAKIEEDFKIY